VSRVVILKLGSTFPFLAETMDDFEDWVMSGLKLPRERVRVCRVAHGEALPTLRDTAGAVITGSHAMVTDRAAWSERTAGWIAEAVGARVPLLGICYGHQLMAHALGGMVGDNPQGDEVGTVDVTLNDAARSDPLLEALPRVFKAHACHSQTALSLPPGAVVLGASARDPHHAFRMGDCAWGVQFHPEFNAAIVKGYLCEAREELTAQGQSVDALLAAATDTPESALVLRRFAEIAGARR
jgi:GMP synthase (glutamine-hydrolysing)